MGFPVTQEGDAGAGGEGFGSGVAFVALQIQDHGAVVLDVARVLGGGVKGFVEMVGGGVVL